jgi:hypothetical protein
MCSLLISGGILLILPNGFKADCQPLDYENALFEWALSFLEVNFVWRLVYANHDPATRDDVTASVHQSERHAVEGLFMKYRPDFGVYLISVIAPMDM